MFLDGLTSELSKKRTTSMLNGIESFNVYGHVMMVSACIRFIVH